jgi:hypothetical protein
MLNSVPDLEQAAQVPCISVGKNMCPKEGLMEEMEDEGGISF